MANSPLVFTPIYQERIWGGRRLADLFGKKFPAEKRIGESWEIVDRPEAQSVVANGAFKGHTLHELWSQHRQEVFGKVPDAPRFPLLIKLLDAREKLSLQVHPPEKVAAKLGGEPKTECWYIAAAELEAELFVGFKRSISRGEFEKALRYARQAVEISPHHPRALIALANIYLAMGQAQLAREVFAQADTTNEQYASYRAFMYLNERKTDSAFVWFDKVKEWGIPILITLRTSMEMQRLENDPRRRALFARLGLDSP